MICYAIKIYYKIKNEPSLYERLRNAGIHPTIRMPPKHSDQKEEEPNSNNRNNYT